MILLSVEHGAMCVSRSKKKKKGSTRVWTAGLSVKIENAYADTHALTRWLPLRAVIVRRLKGGKSRGGVVRVRDPLFVDILKQQLRIKLPAWKWTPTYTQWGPNTSPRRWELCFKPARWPLEESCVLSAFFFSPGRWRKRFCRRWRKENNAPCACIQVIRLIPINIYLDYRFPVCAIWMAL